MNADHDRSGWFTVEAAAKRLGVSASTVKRRIQDGKPIRTAFGSSVEFDREMVERPQGHEWLVRFRSDLPPISSAPERSLPESTPAPSSDQGDSGALTALVDALAEERAERQRLAAENAELRERVGRAEADAAYANRERQRADDLAETLIALRAALSAKEAALADTERERDRLRNRGFWARLWDR
jgi:excisionase family DNA binding protein